MVRVKIAANEVAILDNGHVYLFDSTGRCTGEDVGGISKYAGGALALPCISILSSNKHVDIALFTQDDKMSSFEVEEDSMTCAMKIQMHGGFLRMLRHDGAVDRDNEKIRFNQLIFVYRDGTDLNKLVSGLTKKG